MARKILLADDSVTAQNMGRKILADAGYDVVTVNNGSAALKRITEIKPDLIVLDVYMPGYSGLEVCQRLKDAPETAHIPVLLTVGKLEPFKPEEARRVRADAHIVKPFEASELLTAITKLEDRMVPQQSDGSRFSTSVSGVERFGGDAPSRKTEGGSETDTGWKSRLRFPSKKKKEELEPEPEDTAAGATFRDFRKGKSKTGASAPFTVKPPAPPGQEPGLVPDIPRDITPEELDALSALAAKLDGPIPETENIAPLAEKMGPVVTPAAEVVAAKTEAEVPVAAAEAKSEDKTSEDRTEAKKDIETPALVVEPPAAPASAIAVEAQTSAIQEKSPVEIPVEQTESPVEAVAVNAASLVEEPAPVDRADEPMFASAPSAIEPAAEEKIAEVKIAEIKSEEKPAEAVAKSEEPVGSSAEAVVAKDSESKPEESQAQKSLREESKTEELKPESNEQPVSVAAIVPEPVQPEEPAPSDEELAEALRLLTPATGHTDVSTIPSHGTLVAAGQLLAEEAAHNASAAPRWIAEAVALSPEEAAISLEEEMFRTFASMPVPAAVYGSGMEAAGITGVSAIAAAVESRMASLDLASSAKVIAEQRVEDDSATHGSQTTGTETSTAAAAAEVMAAASNPPAAPPDATEPEPVASEKAEATTIEAEQKDSPPKAAEEAPKEEVASATFADAMSREIEASAEQGEPASSSAGAVAEENEESSSEGGGQESMGKDVKAKSGKSNWHQLRTAPAGAAAAGSDVVEAAKQAVDVAEEAPKAMAAAAAEGSSSTSAPDASTIASIVDSVMADLRPKIVAEIAKKLAGK